MTTPLDEAKERLKEAQVAVENLYVHSGGSRRFKEARAAIDAAVRAALEAAAVRVAYEALCHHERGEHDHGRYIDAAAEGVRSLIAALGALEEKP